MIRIKPVPGLIQVHSEAVLKRIQKTYSECDVLRLVRQMGEDSIESFIKADTDRLWRWVRECPDKLKFTQFKDMYEKYFSNGSDKYVDGGYNAYSFLEGLGITVCPYCDDEYLDIVDHDGKRRRTCEIDHFFPKGKYPALAMCFYNLIPSGQNCNGLKLEKELGMSPYEVQIEQMTYLYPDIPVGVSLEKIDPTNCKVFFHPKQGMKKNVTFLCLEQRYERHAPEAYRLLRNLQNYNEEKIQECVRIGLGTREEIISSIFGPQDPVEKKRTLRQKMLRDLTGY